MHSRGLFTTFMISVKLSGYMYFYKYKRYSTHVQLDTASDITT